MYDDKKHSSNSIKILFCDDEKKNKRNITKEQLVGHLPEHLAKILYRIMKEWRILSMEVIITGEKWCAPEGTWVLEGGIELPCTKYIYA